MADAATNPTAGGDTSQEATLDRMHLKQQRSLWGNAWRQFRKHRLAMTGLVLFIGLVLLTFVGTPLYSGDKDAIDFANTWASPSLESPLGTDSAGRDLFARILWGGRVSLSVGILAAAVAISLGIAIGAIAGFFGGTTDTILMRITDLFLSLPQLPLLLLITYLFKDALVDYFDERFGDGNIGIFLLIVVVIAALAWMQTARLVRAQFISTKEKEFVEAARSIGATRSILIFRHILPNVLSPIIVAATLEVGAAIIVESALSFLGLGFPSDVPTWGRMLYEGKDYLQLAPQEALITGTFIFITVLSINYIGDGLRDALDPRKTS